MCILKRWKAKRDNCNIEGIVSQRAVKNLGKIPSDTPEPVAMSEVSHMI